MLESGYLRGELNLVCRAHHPTTFPAELFCNVSQAYLDIVHKVNHCMNIDRLNRLQPGSESLQNWRRSIERTLWVAHTSRILRCMQAVRTHDELHHVCATQGVGCKTSLWISCLTGAISLVATVSISCRPWAFDVPTTHDHGKLRGDRGFQIRDSRGEALG